MKRIKKQNDGLEVFPVNRRENKKAPEELDDDLLDAVAGGLDGYTNFFRYSSDGVLTCTCGMTIIVGSAKDAYCPGCGIQWKCVLGSSGWQSV